MYHQFINIKQTDLIQFRYINLFLIKQQGPGLKEYYTIFTVI